MGFCVALLIAANVISARAQTLAYKVYAIRFAVSARPFSVADWAKGPKSDSVKINFVIWLIEGNGRYILVDAGFLNDVEDAREFEVVDAAVDGVNVHDSDGAGDGCDFVDEVFVGGGDHDGGMAGASAIGGSDQIFYFTFGKFIDLFQEQFHFRRRRRTHDEDHGLAVGPVPGLAFADLEQVGYGDGGDGI